MNYQYYLLILLSAGSLSVPVCASSDAFKKAQEKLAALTAGMHEHQSALALLGAVSAYGVYKKSPTVQAGIQSSWKQMKAKSQELYSAYNKPVTVGFWARLTCLLVGGNYACNYISSCDKQKISGQLKKGISDIRVSVSEHAQQVKEKFDALSVGQKVAATIGVTAVVTGGACLVKKAYTKITRTDSKAAFAEFKAALTESQRTNYSALIDQIEKDPQLLYAEAARDLLVELSTAQYKLAERIVATDLR